MTDRLLMSPPDVGQVEEDYVVRAIRSGWVAPAGPDLSAFEEEIAAKVGISHAVAMSSGTAALHLAMVGVGVSPGDVVLVPTMTFVASANAVTYTGATPCFVDAVASDGNVDPELLESAIFDLRRKGQRIGAVMSVDLLGRCADYTAIVKVCADAGIPLIEDAAESLGAVHPSGAAGTFGVAAALSFNGNKVMTTSGGGMLLTNDNALADHARKLSTQAREPVLHYEHKHVGYNYRMSNILAALGRGQLSRLDDMIDRRRAIRTTYRGLVQGSEGIRVFGGDDDAKDNCWLTALVIDPSKAGFAAPELMSYLDSQDIESRPLWKPMHLQPVYATSPRFVNGTAEILFQRGVTLPSGSVHGPEAIARVVDAIDSFMRGKSAR